MSSNHDAQQISAYGLDCLVDLLRIAIALTQAGIYLAPIVAAVLAVFWWSKVKGKNRIIGIAVIAAATIFICLGRSSLNGLMKDRLALLRQSCETLHVNQGSYQDSSPEAPDSARYH